MLYIFKITKKATDANINFKGKTRVYYCGKNNLTDRIHSATENESLIPYIAKSAGYKSLKSAERYRFKMEGYYMSRDCFETKFWTTTIEIVPVEDR